MSMTLEEGVRLHVIPTPKYKTIRILIRFATALSAETISKRTLLSSLLETNSQKYPTQTAMSEKLADLYGASFGINVSKKGDNHYLSISLNLVNDKFLPNNEAVLPEAFAFLKEVLFYPNIEAKQFDLETFTREQLNLKEYIASVFDDKQSHAALALQELYFQEAAHQKMPSFGTIEDVERETAVSLATYYQEMLAEDQVDILVIGDVSETEIEKLVKDLPFTPRSTCSKQNFYRQAKYADIREKVEKLSVSQAKLNLAYQTGIYYHEENYFALQVFNGLFGGFPHSKLFMNVREKESMAYYASSSIDTFRGLLTVQTGIDGTNKERVLSLIEEQLLSLQQGQVTEEELTQTKEMLKNHYQLSLDNPSAILEGRYLETQFEGTTLTDHEWLTQIDQVSLEAIQKVAEGLTLQAVYFMEGGQS